MTEASYICNFIKDHPDNWRELFAEKQIKVKDDPALPISIFNYEIMADFSDPVVQEARGIIINTDTLDVVCFPFDQKADTAWWLRSRGKYDSEAACVFDDYGYAGNYFVSCNLGVRPALEISDLKSSDLKIGDKFIFGEHDFTIISDKYALCDDIIGKCAFRKDWKDVYNANVYEKSDVRKFVDDWFAKEKEKGITITMQEELEEDLDKE